MNSLLSESEQEMEAVFFVFSCLHVGLTERQAEEHGEPHRCFYLLVLLLKDVWGVLKLMFSYTLEESSFVML